MGQSCVSIAENLNPAVKVVLRMCAFEHRTRLLHQRTRTCLTAADLD
jgi:hypothetical protein